jgi:hypothetical protein
MNKGKKNGKEYACCDDEKRICDTCSFEESIKVKVEEEENEQ